MKELSSTEFRKTFARVKEPTLVTVNGHPIGYWVPGAISNVEATMRTYDPPTTSIGGAQTQRDELLNKINRSK